MSKGCEHCLHPLWAGIRCGVCGRWADENGDPSEKLEAAWDAYKKALKEFDCPRCGHCCKQEEQKLRDCIRSLTEQGAALVQERDELQKQVWRYERHGVTCQTYRHHVQGCGECNNDPPRREWQGLTDEEIGDAFNATNDYNAFARAIEAALKEKNK